MVDINTVRSNWRSRGFSCDVWTDPPGQTWEDYRHPVDEVVMIVEHPPPDGSYGYKTGRERL